MVQRIDSTRPSSVQRSEGTEPVESAPPPPPPEPVVEPALDRRAQRNLTNLTGQSNFSSPSLPAVTRNPGTAVAAAQTAAPAASPQDLAARGVEGYRVQAEIRTGVETRRIALDRANSAVKDAEAALAVQVTRLQHSLTPDQLQRYAADYRATNPAYATAQAASTDLANYIRDNASRLGTAMSDLRHHPFPNGMQMEANSTRQALDDATRSLETYVSQSPTGSTQLQATLAEAGRSLNAATVIGGTGFAVGQLGNIATRLADVATRAAGAFGVAAGALNAADNLQRLLQDGRIEHAAGLAANGAQIVGGALRIAGIGFGATVGIVGTVAAVLAKGVSAYRDNEARVSEMTERLGRLGIPSGQAEVLARGNPAAYRALSEAGYSPEQIQRMAAQGQSMVLRAHESSAQQFAEAARRLGLDPERATQLMERLGPRMAAQGADALTRLVAGNPEARTREELLRLLSFRSDPLVSDATRQALLAALR